MAKKNGKKNRKSKEPSAKVTVTTLADYNATVARVSYAGSDVQIPLSAAGSAKREPGDDRDSRTGRLLATSRALEVLAAKLRKKANGRIRNAAAIKQHREDIRQGKSGQRREPRPGDVTMSFRTVGPVTMVIPVPEKQQQEGSEE